MSLIQIKNLRASINGTEILKDINLDIKAGEIHAIMGPNGSGKSTLAKVIAGHPDYTIESGEILYDINFKQKNINEMEADERSREGIFLAFQYPVEVPGVNNSEFLRASLNAVLKHQGSQQMDAFDFTEHLQNKMQLLNIDENFAKRQVNVDFSGGEKKRNEILQMAILDPRLALLDETDSGLDVDSLRQVAEGVNKLHDSNKSFVLITHYQRLLNYIVPDFIHILHDGRIVKSGTKELALEVEQKGFEHLIS